MFGQQRSALRKRARGSLIPASVAHQVHSPAPGFRPTAPEEEDVSRCYLAGISSLPTCSLHAGVPGASYRTDGAKGCIGSVLRQCMASADRKRAASNHLNLKFSRLSSLIDRQPISFMSRSISLWRF